MGMMLEDARNLTSQAFLYATMWAALDISIFLILAIAAALLAAWAWFP